MKPNDPIHDIKGMFVSHKCGMHNENELIINEDTYSLILKKINCKRDKELMDKYNNKYPDCKIDRIIIIK